MFSTLERNEIKLYSTFIKRRSSSFILILCGIPAVGKTTLAKALINYISYINSQYYSKLSLFTKCKHIEFDEIINYDSYSDLRKIGEKQIEVELENNNTLIICDDNMYYKSMRKRIIQLAKIKRIPYLICYIQVPMVDICLLRNKSRKNQVDDNTIKRMYINIEKPIDHFIEIDGTCLIHKNVEFLYQNILLTYQNFSQKTMMTQILKEETDESKIKKLKEIDRRKNVKERIEKAIANGATKEELNEIAKKKYM